ncbi:MAG: hypothetical protein HC769_14990 [Cyanobacteria bacterium CRU_2_1]|nr:hypothetical protein [Cyanobacteria bacterium CRU_2_1]
MTNNNDNVDYFEIFGLSRQDSREANLGKLKEMTEKLRNLGGLKGQALQLFHNDAIETFSEEKRYKKYLEKLDTWKSSTDSKWQAELERERQRAEAEAKKRQEAQRQVNEAQKREQENVRREAEKRQQAEAAVEEAKRRAEEAKRRAIEAEQQAIEAQQQAASPAKTGWQLFGEIAGGVAKHMIDRTLEQRSAQSSSTSNYDNQLAQPNANLSGVWQDGQGIISTIQQRGNQIAVRGSFGFQIVGEGIGTVNGRTVQLRSQSFQGVTESQLELSADGRQLNGWGVNYTTGQRYYVQLWRR